MNGREKGPPKLTTKDKVISGIIIAVLTIGWLLFIWFSPTQAVKVPSGVVRSASVPASTAPRTPVPSARVSSPMPKTTETKIYVVATGIPSLWRIGPILSQWNLADRYADFVESKSCPVAEPCVQVKMGKFVDDTAAETRFGNDGYSISIIFDSRIKSSFIAKSVVCHEFGHVLGLPHISGTLDTCMTAKDGFYRTRPTKLDTRLVNSYGPWNLEKMYELSGKDVDVRGLPR